MGSTGETDASMKNRDPTFLKYTPEQAKNYAKGRQGYHPRLYEFMFKHHKATGGKFGRLIDIGCGPGQATRAIAPYFDEVWGIDGSPEMVNTAAEEVKTAGPDGGELKTKAGKPLVWRAIDANLIDQLIGTGEGDVEEGSIDLLTVATAVHWFDMAKFWPALARLMRPGGTVAFFSRASPYCHPDVPEYKKLNQILIDFEHKQLTQYEAYGNRVCREHLADLTLPWDLSSPLAESMSSAFPKDQYSRNVWDYHGEISATEPYPGDDEIDFFYGSRWLSLKTWSTYLSTASPITRYREANPQDANTERDWVNVLLADIRKVLNDAGHTSDQIRMGADGCLLMFKRSEAKA